MPSSEKRRVVVVGAGIGGMAAAALLAKDGREVTILERNDYTGQYTHPGIGVPMVLIAAELAADVVAGT